MADLNPLAYTNLVVAAATNPSPFGYHHGPIPNLNSNWVPTSSRQAVSSTAQPIPSTQPRRAISAAQNEDAPNPGMAMSSINTGICDIDLGGNLMCGTVFADQPSLRRHIRTAHPGALSNPRRTNTSPAEEAAGQNTIKNWVLSGGWRRAAYVREPGRGPVGGLIDRFATSCEAIAESDPVFAAQYGRHFHREALPLNSSLTGSRKRKQGPNVLVREPHPTIQPEPINDVSSHRIVIVISDDEDDEGHDTVKNEVIKYEEGRSNHSDINSRVGNGVIKSKDEDRHHGRKRITKQRRNKSANRRR
ncbi:hypothetical protein F5Y18DRAFT_393814 [Xylariaceae sp. FL1019]|nr:hypothetical protein F5Y18DRAFT_393814 [Xylariaceae sp. FL1019]